MQVYSAKEIIKLLSNTSCFSSKLNQELNQHKETDNKDSH